MTKWKKRKKIWIYLDYLILIALPIVIYQRYTDFGLERSFWTRSLIWIIIGAIAVHRLWKDKNYTNEENLSE